MGNAPGLREDHFVDCHAPFSMSAREAVRVEGRLVPPGLRPVAYGPTVRLNKVCCGNLVSKKYPQAEVPREGSVHPANKPLTAGCATKSVLSSAFYDTTPPKPPHTGQIRNQRGF